MIGMVIAIFNAAMCALNVALYISDPNPVSLAAAVFCGLMALVVAVMAATR